MRNIAAHVESTHAHLRPPWRTSAGKEEEIQIVEGLDNQ